MNFYNKLLQFLKYTAFFSVFCVSAFLIFDFFNTQDKFPPRTFIGNVDVSNLTREETIRKLDKMDLQEIFAPVITFATVGEVFSFSPQELKIFILKPECVDEAFKITHRISYFEALRLRLSKEKIACPIRFSLDEDFVREILLEIASQIDSTAGDASIVLHEKTGGYNIYPEKPGKRLKVDETLKEFKKVLYEGKTIVPLVVEYYEFPKITEKELRAHPPVHRLSIYTTYYGSHDSPNRIHNIKLIASWIDNTLLMPGDVFSLADEIGDVTFERGFKEAFVIMEKELVPQLGGGACQIGTTLYNAIALADIKVLSRRNHSFYFNIYPLGRDATVYPGQADFKFENDTGYPILIKAKATNRSLSFRIYGTPSGKKVTFSGAAILILDPEEGFRRGTLREVIDNDLAFRTIVRRTVKDKNGEIIKKELIRSFYRLYGDKENVPIRRPEPR